MRNTIKEEVRDNLGFLQSDYEDMQKLADKNGKRGDTVRNGWDVTPEQITLINNPRHPLHNSAVITFYDVNFIKLRRLSYGFLDFRKRNGFNKGVLAVVNQEDLLQQVFCDLWGGWLKLPHDTKQITNAICKCFTYAAVGGLEGVDDVEKIGAA